ncbi:MAG TPA: carbohydrate ABC transporter substrate-binding protein, partial [bacterium]|nr:carbohydrate ABC transporter substrate-binding protein [bacterium]
PTVKEASGEVTDPGLQVLSSGVTRQASASFGIPTLIPSLGGLGGEFNNIYRMAYERIVLRKEAPEKVLPELGKRLEEIFKEANAPLQ